MNIVQPLQSPSALLRRTPLFPGESLVSLLERLTLLNYYASPRTLQQICRNRLESPANQDDLHLPKWAETFFRLADLTHIAPEELYAASNHRFTPCLTLPHQQVVELPWDGATCKALLPPNQMYGRIRASSTAQYCPHCLKNAAYHRVSWLPMVSTLCLEHRCLLTSQCPACHKPVSIQEIVRKRCHICQADLSAAKPPLLEGDEGGLFSQKAIQAWLVQGWVAPSPTLPSQHPAVLYGFLEYLARRLLTRYKDWPALPAPLDSLAPHLFSSPAWSQTLAPEGLFPLLRAAFTGVAHWPQGLFQFLDAYCGGAPSAAQQPLRALQRDWFQAPWTQPAFGFIQQAYVGYLLSRRLPIPVSLAERHRHVAWFTEQTGLWAEEHTAQTLGVSLARWRHVSSYGPLATCRWSSSHKTTPLFESHKVLALTHTWSQGWSIFETSVWLGLETRVVIELVKQGALCLMHTPEDDENHWRISRQSANDFFEKMGARLSLHQGHRRALVCLAEAARETTWLGVDTLALLQGVREGCLPAYKRDPEIPSLGHICFLKEAVWQLPDLFYASRGWISSVVFADEKNLAPRLVEEWVTANHLKPQRIFGRHMYFLRQELEGLAAQHLLD